MNKEEIDSAVDRLFEEEEEINKTLSSAERKVKGFSLDTTPLTDEEREELKIKEEEEHIDRMGVERTNEKPYMNVDEKGLCGLCGNPARLFFYEKERTNYLGCDCLTKLRRGKNDYRR